VRAAIEDAARAVEAYLTALPGLPPAGTGHDARANDRRAGLEVPAAPGDGDAFPEAPTPLAAALEHVLARLATLAQQPGHPGYLAYIPGGGIPLAAIAQMVAMVVNPYAPLHAMAPGLAEIETQAVRRLARMVGLPRGAGGLLTTGGSLATLSAVVAARTAALGERFLDGTIYASTEAHHCLERAASYAGFPRDAIRKVPVHDATLAMDLDAARAMIRSDRLVGRRPFLLVATAGTTSAGAVDDLAGAAALAREEGLRYHVDAAYGGFFLLTTEGRRRLAGIEAADSVVLDPHKGLCLPYGTGALLVRDPGDLRRAAHGAGAYMPPLQADAGEFARVDFSELGPELSRDWRGLRMWLPLEVLGIAPFRENLEEKLGLARRFAEGVRALPGLVLACEPALTVVALRVEALGGDPARGDAATQALLAQVNEGGRVFLSGTRIRGRSHARACFLSFRVGAAACDEALRAIAAALESPEVRGLSAGRPATGAP